MQLQQPRRLLLLHLLLRQRGALRALLLPLPLTRVGPGV
jgi:hypothetical protein